MKKELSQRDLDLLPNILTSENIKCIDFLSSNSEYVRKNPPKGYTSDFSYDKIRKFYNGSAKTLVVSRELLEDELMN